MVIIRRVISIVRWIALALLVYIFFVEVVLRIVRRFYQFPIPGFVARLIDNPIRRQIQPPEQIVDWMGVEQGMILLEVGPGPGTFTFTAANAVGEDGRVYAVDIQELIISTLINKIQQRGTPNIIPEQASAYELPYIDDYFDRVYMIAVLGEIPDKRLALKEFRRVLKEDGYLVIGEFLPDPDYQLKSTVAAWCNEVGFELVQTYGNIMHYLLLFSKAE